MMDFCYWGPGAAAKRFINRRFFNKGLGLVGVEVVVVIVVIVVVVVVIVVSSSSSSSSSRWNIVGSRQ